MVCELWFRQLVEFHWWLVFSFLGGILKQPSQLLSFIKAMEETLKWNNTETDFEGSFLALPNCHQNHSCAGLEITFVQRTLTDGDEILSD